MIKLKKQFAEIVKFKNSLPLINVITFKRLEKLFHLIIYIYLVLSALRASKQIYSLLMLNDFYGQRYLLLAYYASIVVVTIIVLFKRKNLNWVILDLLIITVLND